MKRSEFLKVIEEAINDNYDYCYENGASYSYDAILDVIEKELELPSWEEE